LAFFSKLNDSRFDVTYLESLFHHHHRRRNQAARTVLF
jgi:hypothetical protein